MALHSPLRLIVPAVLTALLITGCSNDRSSDDSEAAGQAPLEQLDPDAKETGDGTIDLDEDRAIIHTATMRLSAGDPNATADSIVDSTLDAGGHVTGDIRESVDLDETHAVVTLRVPAEVFREFLDRVAGFGEEIARTVESTDTHDELLDLDSRIESKQASVDRVRDLMAEADTLDQVVLIEGELTDRETELAVLVARQAELTDAVTFSTVQVHVSTPNTPTPASSAPDGFWAGLSAGWHGFVAFLNVMVTVLGIVLPFVVAFGVPAAVLWWWLRKRSRRKASATARGTQGRVREVADKR